MSTPTILANADWQDATENKAPDLVRAIRKLINETQQRMDFKGDTRVQRSIAYLWAAAEALEGLPGSFADGVQ